MRLIVKTYKGWAINADGGLLGRYWWFDADPPNIPDSLHGHVTAVFKTRKEARAKLRGVKKVFPKAKVERVQVDISI